MNAFSKTDFLNSNYAGKVYQNTGNSALLQLIPPTVTTVLDVGCGAGDNAHRLKSRGCSVTGLTASQAEADAAEHCCDEVVVGDVEGDLSFLEGKKFDAILLSHLLEHLIQPKSLLDRISCFLSNQGRIYVALPNMAFWRPRLQMIRGDWRRTETGPFDKTHLHFWSFLTAPDLVSHPGLEMESHIGADLACPLWPLRSLAPKVSVKIDTILGGYFPNLFAVQTILILKKNLCAH
jgi:SAM-dependent methyltransferase